MAVLTIAIPSTSETLELSGVSLSYNLKLESALRDYQKGYTGVGVKKVFSSRVVRSVVLLELTNLSRDDYQKLYIFIVQKIQFMLKEFTVTVSSEDLGRGTGAPVNKCRLTVKDSTGMVKPKPPGLYDVQFSFMYTN